APGVDKTRTGLEAAAVGVCVGSQTGDVGNQIRLLVLRPSRRGGNHRQSGHKFHNPEECLALSLLPFASHIPPIRGQSDAHESLCLRWYSIAPSAVPASGCNSLPNSVSFRSSRFDSFILEFVNRMFS